MCPSCERPSFTASLRGPLHCAHDDCAALLLPGDEIDDDRRLFPRVRPDVAATVEYMAHDERRVERDKGLVDVTIAALSAVLDELPALGSRVVVELDAADPDGGPLRVPGVVREVTPADGEEGFRVGIELLSPATQEPTSRVPGVGLDARVDTRPTGAIGGLPAAPRASLPV